MKLLRGIPLLFVFASSSLFAADLARVTDLNGPSRIKSGVDRVPLNQGSVINAKDLVEVPSGATLKVQYSNGVVLTVEGPSRFRLNEKKDDGSAPLVDLLQGKLKCDCTQGAIAVRTQVAVSSQSQGSLVDFDYKPLFPSGVLVVHALQGDVSVKSDEISTTIPSGETRIFGNARGGEDRIFTQTGAVGTGGGASSSMPDLSILGRPAPNVLSSNGEGLVN